MKGAVTPRRAHAFVTWTETAVHCLLYISGDSYFLILLPPVTFLHSVQFTLMGLG
jgi:hypothetical protein